MGRIGISYRIGRVIGSTLGGIISINYGNRAIGFVCSALLFLMGIINYLVLKISINQPVNEKKEEEETL